MNHKLLQRNDISCSKTTSPLPLVVTDKGNKFHRRPEYKQPSSEEDPGDLVLFSGGCSGSQTKVNAEADSVTFLNYRGDLCCQDI